jgi:hypothetical protein
MSGLPTIQSICCVALLAMATSACLDPLVSDEVAHEGLVLPAGTPVPSAHDTPSIELQLTANDGVDALVPRLGAFAGGQQVHYWDFGATPDFAAPLFLLAERNAAGDLEKTSHNPIIDSIPGQAGYSPYWTVLFLEVTDTYNGELITSFAAIEEAQALGIVKPPVFAEGASNCPIVASDVQLEVGGKVDPISASTQFFWQGMRVGGFDFGSMVVLRGTEVPAAPMYVLSREGQAPLSEPERGVDITGDADINDSNNILSSSRLDADYSPLCRRVEVTVPTNLAQALIDTTLDESSSELSSATDLFNPGPVAGVVVAFDQTDEYINCPQQMSEGDL